MGQTELPRRKTLFSWMKSFCETGIVNRSVVPLKDSVITAQTRGLRRQGCLRPLYNLTLNFSSGGRSTKVLMEPPTLRRSCHFSNAGCHQNCPHKPFSCQNTAPMFVKFKGLEETWTFKETHGLWVQVRICKHFNLG